MIVRALVAVILCFACLPGRGAETNSEGWSLAVPGYQITFPLDHRPHYDFRTEWWYFTGHLADAHNKTYGFELTFFRVGVAPSLQSPSAWRAQSIYLAHFTLTDDQGKRFVHYERASRGALEEADAKEDQLQVWLRDWHATMNGEEITLFADTGNGALELILHPETERGHQSADQPAGERPAAAGQAAVVGERLREPHADPGADGCSQADEEGGPTLLRGECCSEQRRQSGHRAVHQPGEPRLHDLELRS